MEDDTILDIEDEEEVSSGSGAGTIEIIDRPLSERLKPTESFHGELLSQLISRRDLAKSHIDKRAKKWKEVNNRLRMYIDLSKSSENVDGTTDSTRALHPFQQSVVVPASYSILHVLLTQLMSIYGAREPLLQFRGRSPDDVARAKMIEATIAYDIDQMQAFTPLYSMCQDSLKFGCGIIYDYWNTEYGEVVTRQQPPEGQLGMIMQQLLGPEAFVTRDWGITKEHNEWKPVDPFNYYPDPRMPIGEPQSGEFIGHRFFNGQMYLLERDESAGGPYFNVEELKKYADQAHREDSTTVGNDGYSNVTADEKDRGTYELDHLQVKLIPREWELGDSERPEIWWFTWANDAVIVRAHESPYEHGEFTYSVAESDPDFHSAFNPGIVESIDGLQRYMDWMFNSHIQNLMRHLNDAMILSPALVEMGDVTNPGPGRHIRLSPLGEELLMSGGYSIDNFVHQLPVQDVTSPHLNAVNQMFQLAQRLSAANDPQMGMPTPDRRTLGEIQVINSSSSQRIQLIARIIDAMAIAPLARRSVANRLQYMSMEQYFRIVGDYAQELGQDHILANQDNIQGNYDYIHISGVLPPDPVRLSRTWSQILETLARLVPIMQPDEQGRIPDINKIAMETFKSMGAKNIEDFFMVPPPPPQVMPDEQVAQQEQAGNMVPMDPQQAAMMGGMG